jgi:hypothetical protein
LGSSHSPSCSLLAWALKSAIRSRRRRASRRKSVAEWAVRVVLDLPGRRGEADQAVRGADAAVLGGFLRRRGAAVLGVSLRRRGRGRTWRVPSAAPRRKSDKSEGVRPSS